MSLSAEEHSKRVQRRQGTPGRRVLNSGWRTLHGVHSYIKNLKKTF